MNGISASPPGTQPIKVAPDLYRPGLGVPDEAVLPDGTPTPAWEWFFESYQRHGVRGLQEWREVAARISRERGLAYRPNYGEAARWSLDPVPWIFSPEEWELVESGVAQMLRLASAILADLYGPQTLIDRGVVPASVVLGHRGFLRALHNYPPSENAIGLGLSAIDLARGPGGRFFLLNGRYDCPYGLGVALENRTIINRVLPNLFRRCQVRRIGYFFNEWFECLADRAPSGSGQPRIVILDSEGGSASSQMAFLANYCGITRVHPSDLTVRGAKVWLKALSGLKPVDVIWKATHGRDLDPLEANLRTTAAGVAGIFEAMREGKVSVASHPGSEAIESPGFFPFMGAICQALLGEELLLTPAPTWWCGDEASRKHVIENLSKMVIKSVGHHSDFPTRYGQRLSAAELSELTAVIKANPERYVGQEEIQIATLPASQEQGLIARGAVLRSFCFLDAKGVPHVMPGGLGRVSTAEGVIVSTRDSGESKDIWVRAHELDAPISIERRLEKSRAISPEVVPSRRGENLYWAGRYAERTDSIARFANRLVAGRVAGFSYGRDLEARHEKVLIEALFAIFEAEVWIDHQPDPNKRLGLVLADVHCPAGVGANLRFFNRAAMAAREEWSVTSILAIESALTKWESGTVGPFESPYRYENQLQTLALNLAAFHGLNLDSMTRDEAWGLLDAGCRMERMMILTGLLHNVIATDEAPPMLNLLNESVLFVSDSLGTFQTKFHAVPTTELMIRLLLGEEDYPRSLRYLLYRLEHDLAKLNPTAQNERPIELVVPLREQLTAFMAALDTAPFSKEATLAYLHGVRESLNHLHDFLTTRYFSHAGYQL